MLSAVFMVVTLCFTAFTVDIGYITLTKTQLQAGSDGASLSAGLELHRGWGMAEEKNATELAPIARQAAADVAAEHRNGDLYSTYTNQQRDVRFGQATWNPAKNSWNKAWGVAPYNMAEVTLVRNQTNGGSDGPLPLFFAPILGENTADVSATATIAMLAGVGFEIEPGSSATSGVLPFAVDEQTWNNMVYNGIGSDDFSYNPDTEVVSNGADGDLEVNLYPEGSSLLPPGNRGTVDFGSASNSTSDIARQILNGLNDSDLAYFGGELNLEATPIDVNGDTGISAGFQDELASIIGESRAIPVFSQVTGPGNNAVFTIVRFVGVRIVEVKMTGNPKRVMVQPAPYTDGTVIRTSLPNATTVPSNDTILATPILIR